MKIFKSKNEKFFPGGVVDWGNGAKDMYMEIHQSAARKIGGKQGEVVSFDEKDAEDFYIDGNGKLKHG